MSEADTPSILEALEEFFGGMLARVNTSIPGVVVSYNEATQQAEVLPLIKRKVETETGTKVESLPVVPGVPVVFPGSGPYKITWPVAVGSVVVLLFSQASLDVWLQKGGVVDPKDPRKFDMSDAMAIPGLLPFNEATDQVASDAMVMGAAKLLLGSKNANDPILRQSDMVALKNWLDTLVLPVSGATAGPPAALNLSPTVTGSPNLKAD